MLGGGKKKYAQMAKLKRMGLTPGVSDLVIINWRNTYFMEVKAAGRKQTAVQLLFEKWADGLAVTYTVVRSVEDALARLKTWGIIPWIDIEVY